MSDTQPRKPAGTPSGGEFAGKAGSPPTSTLAPGSAAALSEYVEQPDTSGWNDCPNCEGSYDASYADCPDCGEALGTDAGAAWSWESLATETSPEIAGWLRADNDGSLGVALAHWNALEPAQRRERFVGWCESEAAGMELDVRGEFEACRPLGRASEIAGLTKARRGQQIAATPMGRWVFPVETAPSADACTRWRSHLDAAGRLRDASLRYGFAELELVPGETLGGPEFVDHVAELRRVGMVSAKEAATFDALASFWEAHRDDPAACPTVAADGSIFAWDGSMGDLSAHGV